MDEQIKKVEEALKKTFVTSCEIPIVDFKLNIKRDEYVTFTLTGFVLDKNGNPLSLGCPNSTISDVLENIG